MKRGMAAVLIILLTFAVLIAAGTLFLLYRHFVTNRIMDGGGMENPDAQRDDKELVEFEWRQTRAEVERCFSLRFYLEDEEPSLVGCFTDAQSGEKRQIGTGASSDPSALTLTWVQWFELQHTLGMLELPEYSNPSRGETGADESRITIRWRDGGTEKTMTLDGSGAEEAEAQVLGIAQGAYDEMN